MFQGLQGSSCWWDCWLHLCVCLHITGIWTIWVECVSWCCFSSVTDVINSKLKGNAGKGFFSASGCLSLTFLFIYLLLLFSTVFPFFGSFLTGGYKMACVTRCWFIHTAGAPHGDQDPPRKSNKNNTMSVSSVVKTGGEKREGAWSQ